MSQGAITECLPAAQLPVCDSGWNPRLLVRKLEMGECAALSCPCPMVCFSVPHCLRWGYKGSSVWELARGSLTLKESGEPQPTSSRPHPVPSWDCQQLSLAWDPEQGRKTRAALPPAGTHKAPVHTCLSSAHIDVHVCCIGGAVHTYNCGFVYLVHIKQHLLTHVCSQVCMYTCAYL